MAALPPLPVKVLLGIYLGILTGIIPAFVAWGLALLFRYVTGLTVPALGIMVLSVAMAGVNGGFLALNDPTIVQSSNNVTLVTAVLMVMLVSFYAHSRGDRLGAELPRRFSFRSLRERTLSADVVELVGGRGQVRVRVAGSVEDLEGYPPLTPELRSDIREVEWTFPADAPLDELESRFVDRLRTEFDLADAAVSIDPRARATVAAAPPLSGLSKRIPAGRRAVSVEALVPTGIARGDEVTVHTETATVEGAVVAARTDGGDPDAIEEDDAHETTTEATDGGDLVVETKPAATTTGGEGRITVAVKRADADTLLCADRGRVVVSSRGTRREFELVSLLRRRGQRIRRLSVRTDGALDRTTIGNADVRDVYGVAILAVRGGSGWMFAPDGDAPLAAGDELFAVGTREALRRFEEVVA